MSDLATVFLRQKAVYWEPVKNIDDIYAERDFSDPIEIDVRWVEEQEEFINDNNEKQVSKAKIMVDRELKVNGLLLQTTLDEIDSSFPEDPRDAGALEIKSTKAIPDINADSIVRYAYV